MRYGLLLEDSRLIRRTLCAHRRGLAREGDGGRGDAKEWMADLPFPRTVARSVANVRPFNG